MTEGARSSGKGKKITPKNPRFAGAAGKPWIFGANDSDDGSNKG
jgi:hypothetical protein